VTTSSLSGTAARPRHAELAALARRVAEAIAAAETAPPESQSRAIVFRVGLLRLALPLTSIREVVVPPERLSRVPRASAGVLGIMNLRGRVVAVVDLLHALPGSLAARATDLTPEQLEEMSPMPSHILLLETERHEVGLLVQDVEGIAPLPAGAPDEPLLLDPTEVGQAIDALVL
jgi:chemotaxis signal transduction protein